MLEDPVSFSFMHFDWQPWLTFISISMIFIQHLIYSFSSNLASTLPLFLCGGLRAATGVGGVLFGRRFLTTTSPVSVVSFPSYSDRGVLPCFLALLLQVHFTGIWPSCSLRFLVLCHYILFRRAYALLMLSALSTSS